MPKASNLYFTQSLLIAHRYGKRLIELCDGYKSAETTVPETLLKLRAIWYQTETQMVFLKKIWHVLDPNFQCNQHLLLSVLETKLQEAVRLLNSITGAKSEPGSLDRLLMKKGSVRKAKYALHTKDILDRSLSELMEWRALFDPSWYLIARNSNVDIDQHLEAGSKDEAVKLLGSLRKSIQDINSKTIISSRPISTMDFLGPRVPISASSCTVAQFEGRVQHAIVDTMPVDKSMDPTGTTHSVKALAKALSRMEPSIFGLLRCCGVINKIDRYEFVFEMPQGLQEPRSLRDLLANAPPTLNVKLEIAKQLANSVLYLHATGFVHKNIRPETILIFDRGTAKASFLVGFEDFRGAEDDTFMIGDSLPERELYRHPLRQGNNPEREYVMQHDIYSLGVCLLEIGLWTSFVRTEEGRIVTEFDTDVFTKDPRKRAFAIKTKLLLAADEKLPLLMGQRFKQIVERCLTCLDDETTSTWDQVEEKCNSDIDVGVEFIENVLVQLHEIVI